MIATTHLAVGAAAGLWSGRFVGGLIGSESALVQTVVSVGTAFLIGTASHLVLDAIPHSDAFYHSKYGELPILATELVIIFNVIFWLCCARDLGFLVVFFGMAGGAWLDCLAMLQDLPLFNNHLTALINQFHGYCHSAIQAEPILSLAIQILIAVFALIFLV